MNSIENICKGCMNNEAADGHCSACGFDLNTYEAPLYHLKPGTILAGKYVIGKCIGEGGFGITYIGIDANLNMRVAIKEYYPAGHVTRDAGISDTITIFKSASDSFFMQGRNKFMEEARKLARFNASDGIVSVRDFFLENGTAYIVMEYLDGVNLKQFLRTQGGRISVNYALSLFKPVLSSLAQLHNEGLIHRDISPDNIMVTKDKRVKLIDFGAARDISADGQKSLSILLKPGFAPEEQYRTHGHQGPWTDVYALCATMYMMITGKVPIEANERLLSDRLLTPSQLGIPITPSVENALMQGLQIDHHVRTQNMAALYSALYENNQPQPVQPIPVAPIQTQPVQPEKVKQAGYSGKEKTLIIALSCSALAIAFVAAFLLGMRVWQSNDKSDKPYNSSVNAPAIIATPEPTVEPTPEPTPEPTLPPRPDLYVPGLTYKRMGSIGYTTLVNDETFLELKNVILDFDEKCIRYVNYGDNDVFVYLRSGTTAYNQQVSYKNNHPTVQEILHSVDVRSARESGNTYYVWVTEERTVTEYGVSKHNTDHWVYKLERESTGFIIVDYTKDPAY